MTNTSLVVFMTAIMIAGVVGLSTDVIPNAEALKAKGTSWGNTDICGLSLCSEYPGGKAAYEAEWVSMYRTTPSVVQQPVSETMDNQKFQFQLTMQIKSTQLN